MLPLCMKHVDYHIIIQLTDAAEWADHMPILPEFIEWRCMNIRRVFGEFSFRALSDLDVVKNSISGRRKAT